MKVLMVLTSHDKLGNTGKKTGFWLEEFAAPYYVFLDAGLEVALASPRGGQPPCDPASEEPDAQTNDTARFHRDAQAQRRLADTLRLSDVQPAAFDAIFYPGGHGPLWDLAQDAQSLALAEAFWAAGKPLGAVCHAPGALCGAKKPDGSPLVQGKRVTGFTNSEEKAVGLTDVVPFRVEDALKQAGGQFEHTKDWGEFTLVDGHLVTGQNPASSAAAAQEILKLLNR
jgi:putative intracellular protease/amidase